MPVKGTEARRASAKRYYDSNRADIVVKVTANKKLYIERNKAYSDNAKSVPCTDCGSSYPPHVMDFDHLNDKHDDVSKMVYLPVGLERLKAEIAKCEVVCANCHRLRTHDRRM